MYKHHEESIEKMKKYFEEMGAVALILGGSVTKGKARPDSDLDGMVILTDEDYVEREKRGATTEVVEGHCTYEGGYFDVKYMTKRYLAELACKGSEPARNGFTGARLLFTHDPDIERMIADIPIFQTKEKDEKMLSFYSDFWLNYYYFLKCCPLDGYMKLHAVNEVIYSIYRMILQEHEILFPSNRRLEEFVAGISKETAELVSLGRICAKTQEMPDIDKFAEYFLKLTAYEAPTDIGRVLSQYTTDFEQWWRVPRPNINEW